MNGRMARDDRRARSEGAGRGEALAVFAYHRVDAARSLMHDPRGAAEATGRLFFAKRVHEQAKASAAAPPSDVLARVLDEVTTALSDPRALAGVRREHALFCESFSTPRIPRTE